MENLNQEPTKEVKGEENDMPLKKKKKLSKKTIILIVVGVVIVAGITGLVIYNKFIKKQVYNYVEVEKGTISQEVSVTGRVKPAKSVDLALEVSGKVGAVYVDVGSKVYKGQTLVSLANGELASELQQAQANLDVEKAKFDELKKGTRPEEIQQSETDLANAKSKADVDLEDDYDAALTSAQDGIVKGKNALLTITDLQFKYFSGNDQEDLSIASAKSVAVEMTLGTANAGKLATEDLSKLNGGAYASVQTAIDDPTHANIDKAVSDTLDALQKIKLALNVIPIKSLFTSTEKTSLSTEKTTISTSITTISSKEQAVAVQKVTNANNIATAEDDLALKQAGSTPEQISAQEAKVKSTEASIANIRAKIAKRILTSPINGTVTEQEANVGEIVSANSNLVSLISESNLEIEVFIPEVDVSKVTVGDMAKTTLDAYGNEVIFETSVVSIDPAETMIEGVATYKTTLQFSENDERIKSGMTANIDIMTEQHEGVLFVPARVIVTKNGNKTVEILEGYEAKEVKVETGIRGSEGNMEILEGLEEGDKVIME
ncbi:efflux RND transporter periplasmic adaptor subunit [Patescibacteria group bacterium]